METISDTNTKGLSSITASKSPDEVSLNEFLAQVDSHLNQGAKIIRVDCTPLVRVTSSHIKGLWLAREKCYLRGVSLKLINVGNGLRHVLMTLDLAELFLPRTGTPSHFDLQFTPTKEGIDNAMSTVVGLLTNSGMPEITAFELQTIFYEVATNIRRHSTLSSNDLIKFGAKIHNNVVRFTFTDSGIAFDPTGHDSSIDVPQMSKTFRRYGFGLAMIKRLSDFLEYKRTSDAKNELCIEKSW